MSWLQRLLKNQTRTAEITDDELIALRSTFGNRLREMEMTQFPSERLATISTQTRLIQAELSCRLLDEIRGLREDMARYRNGHREPAKSA